MFYNYSFATELNGNNLITKVKLYCISSKLDLDLFCFTVDDMAAKMQRFWFKRERIGLKKEFIGIMRAAVFHFSWVELMSVTMLFYVEY